LEVGGTPFERRSLAAIILRRRKTNAELVNINAEQAGNNEVTQFVEKNQK